MRQLVEAIVAYVDGVDVSMHDVCEYAPRKIAAFVGGLQGVSKKLADLTSAQFWHEYDSIFGGKTSAMAKGYDVTDGAVSQYKVKHKDFRNH